MGQNLPDFVRSWTNYSADGPEQVKVVFRFLGVVRSLKLIGTEAFMHATMKNRVAKMVIAHVLDSYQ